MSLIARLVDIIVNPCLVESDTYSLQSRKLFVIAFAAIAFNALLLGLPITILNGLYDSTTGGYIVGACFFQVTVTSSIVPYLHLRITKTLPAWVPDLQMWSTIPITLAFTLISHQGSVIMVNGVISLVAIILQVRGWLILLLYTIGIIIFHALINDFADELPALHETFYHTQLLPNKCMYLLGTVVTPLLLMGLGLFYIMGRFSERMNQADAAIAMNLAVADKLRRYDTDGVAEILAANKGKVDENLLEAFTAIQYNLQEYRPHIPDYVIEATMADLSDDDDDGFGESVVMQAGDSMLRGAVVDDDDEGDHSLSLSGSQQSRFPSNHNASFLGSYSSPGTPGVVSQNNSHRPTSSSLKMGRNSPIIGATATSSSREGGGGKPPHHLPNTSPHSSVTDVSFMKSSSLIATHSVPTTLPDPAGIPPTEVATIVGRTSSSSYMWGGQAPVSRQVHDTQTRHEVSQKYAPDTSMAKSTQSRDTNVSDVSGGGLAASRISSNGRGGGGKRAGKQQGGASKTYTGRATTVFIRFVAGTCGSARGTDGAVPRGSHVPTVVEYLGLGVEAVSKHAKIHGGALQYMQGCGLMVSFNAASRVLAHEAKACAFALGLKAEIEGVRRGPLVLHATIVTTPILSFFAGNKGQLVLTVLGGYMPIHTALHHYLSHTVGDDVSCILVSKSTMPNVELHYEARMLGVVGMSSGGQEGDEHVRGSINVQSDAIQLLCSRKATESDEWMYELENQTSTHGFTKKIVDTAASGDLLGAMRIVSEHETAIHDDTLLSRCLHDRIESCIEDSTAFPLHTAPPTKMW